MKQSEDNLRDTLPYLSEVLDTSVFKRGQANIIVSPCHSGKTTAAAKIIQEHASCPERVLYLIDTSAGKEALITHEHAKKCTSTWLEEIDPRWWTRDPAGDRFVVMTYHQFGYKLIEAPTFPLGLDLIICDEMHNLIKYLGIETANNKKPGVSEQRCCRTALETLGKLAKRKHHTPLVVVMTATVNTVSERLDTMGVPMEHFDYSDRVRSDSTKQWLYYADLSSTLKQIDEKAIIYVPTIDMMKRYAGEVNDSRNVCCLWSVNNSSPMQENAMAVREMLLKTQQIPADIDLLFINAAYETSLNIRNEDFNTMVIHNSNPDTQIQVRGRIRHDIEKLYLYDKNHEHMDAYFPEEHLDRFLVSAEVREIARNMNLKDEKGEKMKWPSIYPLLEKSGFQVNKEVKSGKRGWRIHRLSA